MFDHERIRKMMSAADSALAPVVKTYQDLFSPEEFASYQEGCFSAIEMIVLAFDRLNASADLVLVSLESAREDNFAVN